MNLKVELYDDGETWKIEHEHIGEIAHCTSPEWARRLADALNKHDTLRARIAKLEAAQEWHPASEPPNTARSIMGQRLCDNWVFTVVYCAKSLDYRKGGQWGEPVELSRWCELPERAKETEK